MFPLSYEAIDMHERASPQGAFIAQKLYLQSGIIVSNRKKFHDSSHMSHSSHNSIGNSPAMPQGTEEFHLRVSRHQAQNIVPIDYGS